VTRNVGLQTIKAAIEKAVMQRGSYPFTFSTPLRAREGVTRNVGLQTIKAAIEKAVMQRGSYPLARLRTTTAVTAIWKRGGQALVGNSIPRSGRSR